MKYTIQSARFAHSTNVSVFMDTIEAGIVIASEDRPDEWAQLQDWIKGGGTIQDFVPVPIEVKKSEVEELKEALIRKGVLTASDISTVKLVG